MHYGMKKPMMRPTRRTTKMKRIKSMRGHTTAHSSQKAHIMGLKAKRRAMMR